MTATCVVPRGDVLDLLDDLREALPGELDDAQDVLDHRDDLVSRAERRAAELTETAEQESTAAVTQARAEAERMLADAREQAEQMVAKARNEAERIVADGRARYQDMVERAQADADRLAAAGHAAYEQSVADGHAEQARLVAQTEMVRAAHIESGRIIDAGEREASRLRTECDQYVDNSLASFEETLTRTLQIVQRGRAHQRGRFGRSGSMGGRDRIGADLLD